MFHLAAQSYPQTSFTEANLTLDTNIIGTYNLLNAINKSKYKPFVHVCSSSEIFGKVTKEKLPIDEDCSFHPASPYAISKVGTDLIGRYFSMAELLNCKVFFSLGNTAKGNLISLLLVVSPSNFVDGLFISFVISNTQSLQHFFYWNN